MKVHDHRVEPGEMEAALAGLAGADRAAVAPRGGDFVAFVVAPGDPDLAAMRIRLRGLLPAPLCRGWCGSAAEASALPGVPAVKLAVETGDEVGGPSSIPGRAAAIGPSVDEASRIADKAVATIRITIRQPAMPGSRGGMWTS